MDKNLIMGICMAGVATLGAICAGCGDDNCSISQTKSCSTSNDCVLVSCRCCSPEAVNKDCADSWYNLNDCRHGAIICPAIICPPRIAACENQQCIVDYPP